LSSGEVSSDEAPFRIPLQVAWSHLDPNNHMANSAYLDLATHTRFVYLAGRGFGPRHFVEHGLGPAISHEELHYRRELRALETFTSELWMSGYAQDGSRFRLLSRFVKDDGVLAATVEADARWFDLKTRKVTVPPQGLHEAMLALARSETFEVLPSGVR
jgi:acyl-CoA thioester hydrolase